MLLPCGLCRRTGLLTSGSLYPCLVQDGRSRERNRVLCQPTLVGPLAGSRTSTAHSHCVGGEQRPETRRGLDRGISSQTVHRAHGLRPPTERSRECPCVGTECSISGARLPERVQLLSPRKLLLGVGLLGSGSSIQ